MDSVAVTDHGNMYGVVELLKESKEAGVKPIVGIEAYVAPGSRLVKEKGGTSGKEHSFHLTLLAQTGEGVRNLMRLSSKSFLEGFYYKPRIDKEILKLHSEGVICLSGCVASEFSDHLLYGNTEEAEKLADWYRDVFGDRFFIEIQDNGIQIQKDHMGPAVDLANKMGIPLVATSDAHYLHQSDAEAHDALLCINTRRTINDPNRMKFGTNQFHIRSPQEMLTAMPRHAEAIGMSQSIADTVEEYYPSLNFGKRCYPSFETPGETPASMLRRLCEEGLSRYPVVTDEIRKRLDRELAVIEAMGFSSYFLIVWDFVRYAREQGIPCSARGSGCGAIVSYCLWISHIEPLENKLLFERFLDPNRSEAPDIDIDICQDRRQEVIDYVKRKYGEDKVCQIGTFGTLGAKSAIKDVGFIMGMPTADYEAISAMVPKGVNVTITDAINQNPKLKEAIEEKPEVKKMIDLALKVEGSIKSAGTHAAGVVITPVPLIDLVPLQKLTGSEKKRDVVSTQWDMGDVEKAGLLKMDFLGLRNLTILDSAIKIANSRGKNIDIEKIPLDDPKTFQLLKDGKTKGVFQLESPGMRDLLGKMQPDKFGDISAILALFRPGPLGGGMVDAYINRKHGVEKWEDPHPMITSILKDTYSVLVYQESCMQIMNQLGGVDLNKAYTIIKAISKKKYEDIEKGRSEFVDGCEKNGLARPIANDIYDKIVLFGGYAFNGCIKSDSVIFNYDTGERHTIGDICEKDLRFRVSTINDKGLIEPKMIRNAFYSGTKKTVLVRTVSGKEIEATECHKFMTIDGWTEAKNLYIGSMIAANGSDTSSWDKIVEIKETGEHETCDLEIDDNHNFLANGLFVHNSHSAAYALIAYRTAYMKAHHPTEFFAALLTSEIGGSKQDVLPSHIDDARKFGVVIHPPNANKGGSRFEVADDWEIYFGLASVKSVGEGSVASVISSRGDGYDSIDSVVSRADLTESQVNSMILAGAFDCLGKKRSQLLAMTKDAVASHKKSKKKKIQPLFDIEIDYPDIPELPEDILLEAEKRTLGYYVSGHPLKFLESIMRPVSSDDISDVVGITERQDVVLAGMVGEIETKQIRSQRSEHTTMARFRFEDLTGSIQTVVWPSDYAEMKDLREGLPCVLKGYVQRRKSSGEEDQGQETEFYAKELITLDMIGNMAKGVVAVGDFRKIHAAALKSKGRIPLFVEIPVDQGRIVLQTQHKVDFPRMVGAGIELKTIGRNVT